MKQPNWLRCLQCFVISVVTFEVVIQVECAEYRTIDVVNDGRVLVSDRRSDNVNSQVAGEGNEFSPRKGSLDIRSRFWSDTGTNQPDYPEEPEEAESSQAYATLSADNGEYVSNLEERSDQHAYVTVDRDRKNKEHLVTISMPRMAMKDKTHLFKKFVIQPVIQYVVQYDKASGRRRVARNGRQVEEEEQTVGQKSFADYQGYQGQESMRRGHGQKIDRFFNDINANFDTFWGNDGNGGGGGYPNSGGGGGSSGGYQNNGNGGGSGSSGGYQNSGEGFSQDGGSDGEDFSDGGSDGGYDTTSQMHQPPEVNAFVTGGGYGDNPGGNFGAPGSSMGAGVSGNSGNPGNQYGPPKTPMGTGASGNGGNPGNQYGPPGSSMGAGVFGNGGNAGNKYGPPGTDPGTPLGPGTFSNSGNAGGMTLSNAMQMSSQPAQNQQQNNPAPMYGPPGMMSVVGGNSGNAASGQMMGNMGMRGPSFSSNGAPSMVQMSGMGMNMGMGGMSQVAPSPMMQGSMAPAQGMIGSMPMSMGPASISSGSGFVVSGMSAGQPMVTSQLTPQQMMMMPMSAGGGAMQQQSMTQGGMQMPMGQGQPGMQLSMGQGQTMMSGGTQVATGQSQSTILGGAVNQGNMGMAVANAATSSGVSGTGVLNGAGTAMGSQGQQMGGMANSNANAAALLMQSMHAQSAALGAIGALTSQMNSNTALGANVQNILMGMGGLTNMGQLMNMGGSGAASGSSGAGGSSMGVGGIGTSYGPPQELKAPAPSYGPPKEMKEPAPSYGPPKDESPPATSEHQGGYGGSGTSAEDQGKGGRGKKPGGMMMGGRGKSKGKGGRGGKSLFSSLSLPKLPMIPTSLGGQLSFMFSTGFGKGKRGGKMGMTGGGGGSSKPSGASEGKPIDQEQVSDHILNILGLTVHHPPRHSMLHSNQSASSITNTTSPLELWEQEGNLSSLNHLTSLIQAGTPEDVVAHLPVPEAEDMDMNRSSKTTEQPTTTNDPEPSITSTTSLPITTTDVVTMTTENDVTLSETTMIPTTTSSPEENVTISSEFGTTTTVMPTPTTNPPTTVPPTTTLQVSSTTPRLPLNIRKAKAFYLPVQDIPSSLPTTAVFLTPPPPPPHQLFPGPTPPQFFPTMSTIYDHDPLKEYINQNLQNNVVTLHEDTTARRPHLNNQNPNLNHPQEFQTSPNIEAYYASPNFHGNPPVKLAQFDPMIYEALRAAFQPGHSTHLDNGVYFFETMNSKRKRNSRNRRRGEVEPIPLKDFRARSRRFHKVKGFTTN